MGQLSRLGDLLVHWLSMVSANPGPGSAIEQGICGLGQGMCKGAKFRQVISETDLEVLSLGSSIQWTIENHLIGANMWIPELPSESLRSFSLKILMNSFAPAEKGKET